MIRPITNRLCEEYGLSIVAAEYSKDPVNMNRNQWEKEQSWGDFITGDMQYCRNKAERYQQDLIRMKELQEEYLFLNREGINGWEDVFRAKQTAEQKITDIDAKKKELYKEHARYKYQYEKDGDVTIYLYHEAHYREQLAELKERRKEAKMECATINRCINESTFAHMEIPLDVDVEDYETEQIDVTDVLPEVNVLERELVAAEVLKEEGDGISEQELDYGVNESETVTKLDEPIDEFMRLESVVAQMKRDARESEKERDRKIEPKSRSL